MPVDLSWLNATMRAVVYDGVPFSMGVRAIAKPTIRNSADVVVRVTTATICGSDLHIYRGFMGGIPPWTMGHEAVGYVSEIGDAVSSFNVGDYVIIPDTVSSDQLELEPTSQEYFGFGNSVMGLGAIPIDFARADPVAQILAREPSGVMRSVDCVGMEALNADLERDAGIVVNQMINVTHFGGGVGQLGVFKSQDNSPGAPYGSAISPSISFPISSFFGKALSFRTGAVDPKRYAPMLIGLINSGKAHPSFVFSADIGIEDAPKFYNRFYRQMETKVAIYFPK